MTDKTIELLSCPFCGGNVRIGVFDNEGNPRPEEYENDPWSGLAFSPLHYERDAIGPCVIATHDGEPLGMFLYDTRGELVEAWNRRQSTDAAPGEALDWPSDDVIAEVLERSELGRELIAWAAEEDASMRYDENGVHHCLLCGTALVYNNDRHADDCLHLRARALRESE